MGEESEHQDYTVRVKDRLIGLNPYKWAIYRAGWPRAVKGAASVYRTAEKCRIAGTFPLRLQLRDLALETRDLELLGLHLTLSGERMLRILRKRLHPTAKLRLMHTQVLPGLRIRYAAILDQPHSLKLELAGKLPSLHDPPPAPSKHLTRCLRNRVQASPGSFTRCHSGGERLV